MLTYHTIDQTFRLTIGKLFGLEPTNYYYEPISYRKYFGKNVLDYDEEGNKVFEKKLCGDRLLSP